MASNILLNIRNRLITSKEISLEVIRRFSDDHCFTTAASLSYTTLLALVPFATVVFSVLSLFPVSEYWSDTMEKFLFDNFVPAAGDTVRGYIHEFSTQAGKLTAVGLVFLLFSSLSLLATIEDSFNDIWKVTKGRKWFQRLLVYWALLTLGPVLIAVSLSMSSALLSTTFLSNQGLVASFTETLLRYLPIFLEICAFMLFYQSIPNLEVKFSDSFTGALVATILFYPRVEGEQLQIPVIPGLHSPVTEQGVRQILAADIPQE